MANNTLSIQQRKSAILFCLPALLFVFIFLGIPILQSIYYSMTKWNGLSTTWVGPTTYLQEFKNPIFWQVLGNNALLLLAVPIAILIPMGVAFLLNEKVIGWQIFRSVYFLPTALSWVVIGMISVRFFAQEGLLNSLLKSIGLGSIKTDLLASERSALLAIGITFVWSMTGTNIMIFLTGMSNLDISLNEAAKLDGASAFQILRKITLPQLKKFIQFSFVITVISAFTGLFSLIFVMTGGGPGFGTTTLEFFVYQSAFSKGDFGKGSMLGLILFVIMAGLGAFQLTLTRSRE